MITREAVAFAAQIRDLVLRTPPNWSAIVFFSALSMLHFAIAIPAFYRGRVEGLLSLILGCTFVVVSVISYFARHELAILPQARTIRVRNGVGRLRFQRFIPFEDVHAVRLTLSRWGRHTESRIEVLCDNEDLECPPTSIPRQEALCLALVLGVQLIRVSNEGSGDSGNRGGLSDREL
jgi:hypothetical protein